MNFSITLLCLFVYLFVGSYAIFRQSQLVGHVLRNKEGNILSSSVHDRVFRLRGGAATAAVKSKRIISLQVLIL